MELVDRSRRPLALEAGDIVILASDGIHTLAHAAILDVVQGHAAAGPDGIAEALLAAVEAAGEAYQDNTTVVVVTVKAD
jgi:serine/threonine protein phosphatase PrpC